jgi:hypothetical protein
VALTQRHEKSGAAGGEKKKVGGKGNFVSTGARDFLHPALRGEVRWREFGGPAAMERKVVVVCSVVGFLGVLSAALGFAAEGTRVKVRPAAPPPSLSLSLARRG